MLDTIFVGMDVHKATISVAVGDGEVRQLGNFLNRADHVDKLVRRLSKTDGRRLRFCYEAGPCGYGLHRQMVDSDVRCNPVDSIGSSTESRVSHSEPPPSARFPRDKDGPARRYIEPLQ